MIFQREGCKPLPSPGAARLDRELSLVKSSFAHLTSAEGAYLQVAGGPGLFLLEYREAAGHHYRATQETPKVPFPNGTILQFSSGNVAMNANEWFVRDQVVQVLATFAAGAPWPPFIRWRALDASFQRNG